MTLLSSATMALLGFAALGTGALAAPLTIEVAGLHSKGGDVVIRVFKSSAEWPRGKAVLERKVKPSGETAVVKIEDLPAGTYAITGYHDENGNGEHDKTLVGVPEEGFLFSNDVKPDTEAPKFEPASFKHDGKSQKLTIHMQYWSQDDDKKNKKD